MRWLLNALSFGATGTSDASLRTLEAAYQRLSRALQEARKMTVELQMAEKHFSAAAEKELRSQRFALESAAEKLRLRLELFRTEKLAVGARYVAAQATSRSGETLAALAREAADVGVMVERAKETLAKLQTESG
jgi:hypothetical protein